MTPLLASLCAGVAAWLLVSPHPHLTRGVAAPQATARTRWARLAVVGLAGGATAVVLADARVLAWGLLAGAVLAGTAALWRRAEARREATRRSAGVAELCELLAAELGAGQPPGRALARAAADWPELAPVARAQAVGGDVPTALRLLAARPGAGDLRLVAAAWQVAQASGAGLAEAVGRVAGLSRAAAATRRVVGSELASARATARLVAALPLLALLMGGSIGGDPVGFLLGSSLGLACLAGGLALGWVGLWWIEAIADGVEAGAR